MSRPNPTQPYSIARRRILRDLKLEPAEDERPAVTRPPYLRI